MYWTVYDRPNERWLTREGFWTYDENIRARFPSENAAREAACGWTFVHPIIRVVYEEDVA